MPGTTALVVTMGRVQTHNRSTDLGSCTRTAAHHLKAIRCLLSCARLLPCRHPSVHLYDSSSLAAAGLTSQLIALRDVWNAYGRCTAAGDAITYLTLGLDLDLAYPLVRALHNVCVCVAGLSSNAAGVKAAGWSAARAAAPPNTTALLPAVPPVQPALAHWVMPGGCRQRV